MEDHVADLSSYSTESLPVLANESRWSAAASVSFPAITRACTDDWLPMPLCDILDRGLLPESGAVPSNEIMWAKSYNLGWQWTTGGGSYGSKRMSSSKLREMGT